MSLSAVSGSVAQLQSELAQLTDIASEFQVLITSDGEYIRCDDQNERCFRKNIDLFLFDRRIMKGEKEIDWLEFEITESITLACILLMIVYFVF